MFTVSGHVNRPGVYEVEFGTTTFRELLYGEHYGDGILHDNRLKAFIPGGASAPWFFEEHLDLPLETGAVGAAGSMLGSGAIVVMDETTDAVKAAWRVVRFFARESCGKCTPCREGTTWLERILRRMLDGYGRPSDVDKLLDICDNISPAHHLAAQADDDLPARTLCGVAHRLGGDALPRRVLRLLRRRARSRSRSMARPTCRRLRPSGQASDGHDRRCPRGAARRHRHRRRAHGQAAKGELVIDAAERNGIYIPRFCYHPRMRPVGMCRMCIVDIDTGRGAALQPACMIECSDGMTVSTGSPVRARRRRACWSSCW